MKETIKFANLPVFKEQWEKNIQKPIEVLEKKSLMKLLKLLMKLLTMI